MKKGYFKCYGCKQWIKISKRIMTAIGGLYSKDRPFCPDCYQARARIMAL